MQKTSVSFFYSHLHPKVLEINHTNRFQRNMLSDEHTLREIGGSSKALSGFRGRGGSRTNSLVLRKKILEEDTLLKNVSRLNVFCIPCGKSIKLASPYSLTNWIRHKQRMHPSSPPPPRDSEDEVEGQLEYDTLAEDEHAINIDEIDRVALQSRKLSNLNMIITTY